MSDKAQYNSKHERMAAVIDRLRAPKGAPRWLAGLVDDVLLFQFSLFAETGLRGWLNWHINGWDPAEGAYSLEEISKARRVFRALPHLFTDERTLPAGASGADVEREALKHPAVILLELYTRHSPEDRRELVLSALDEAAEQGLLEPGLLEAWQACVWHHAGREELVLGMLLQEEPADSERALGHAVKTLRQWRDLGLAALADHYQPLALGL